ncbi:MAG TPA: glycoside hydrolase family 28 protein [Opitutaceae bacterium]|nr:glycoside hydrolase family 28 protein [Opitutaceae bacterium]
MRLPRALPACLALLCLAPARAAEFDVAAFGAPRDGSAPATAAIQAAIDAARAAGGGTVIVPPGRYRCGPIALASNLTLEIQRGAVLEFPPARLPYAWGRVQGIECLAPVPLIGATRAENVAITGGGEITTDNAAWVRLFGGPTPKSESGAGSAFGPAWNRLLALLQQKTPQPESEYLKAAPLLRPDFVRFRECRNVRIDGLRLVGSPFWSIHLLYSENVSVRGAVLQTFPGAFTGGIYVDSSRDVRISDCSLDDGDDAITLKAGKDADGLRVNRPTEDVVISHCVIRRGSGGIVIGSETSGRIRRVVVSDIVCQGTQAGINLKSERGRGGGIEDVRMDNLVMDDVGRAISISEYYSMQGETPSGAEPVSARTPLFRDISIRHVVITRARGAFDFGWNPMSISGNKPGQPVAINIAGLPERPIEHLRLSDITASGAGGLRAENAAGLALENIRLAPARGPGFLIRDCPDLQLEGLHAELAPGQGPALRLDRCLGATVRGCSASPGPGAVLSADPAGAGALRGQPAGLPVEASAGELWTAALGPNG